MEKGVVRPEDENYNVLILTIDGYQLVDRNKVLTSEASMAIWTISRQLGSGIREIRTEIAKTLKYSYVDKECILGEIRERGARWEKWALEFDRSSPTTWEKYDWSFKGFCALLQSIMLSHSIHDNVILAGRGSNFLLEDIPHAYRVRFVAPMEQRIERIAAWKSVDRDTARNLATNMDRERAGFVHAVYKKDLTDPKFYDAVFDTGVTPADEIVRTVIEALLAKDKLKTEAAQHTLRMRAAAARVMAGLMIDTRLYVPTLEVICGDTELILRGIVRNTGQYSKISEAARYFAEDFPIKIELRFRF